MNMQNKSLMELTVRARLYPLNKYYLNCSFACFGPKLMFKNNNLLLN